MVLVLAAACGDDGAATPADTSTGPSGATSSGTTAPTSSGTETGGGTEIDPNALANGCYALRRGDDWMIRTASDDGYALAPSDGEGAARFFLKASDLGTYLLYDEGGGYLVAEDGPLLRQTELASDLTLVDDTYVSGAEWMIEPAAGSPGEAQLHHLGHLRRPDGRTDATPAPRT